MRNVDRSCMSCSQNIRQVHSVRTWVLTMATGFTPHQWYSYIQRLPHRVRNKAFNSVGQTHVLIGHLTYSWYNLVSISGVLYGKLPVLTLPYVWLCVLLPTAILQPSTCTCTYLRSCLSGGHGNCKQNSWTKGGLPSLLQAIWGDSRELNLLTYVYMLRPA